MVDIQLTHLGDEVIDITKYPVSEVVNLPIPIKIKVFESDTAYSTYPDIYCRGFYLPGIKKPLIYDGVNYNVVLDGNVNSLLMFFSLKDVDGFFNNKKNKIIGNFENNVLNAIKYNSIRRYLKDRSTYPIITNEVVQFIINNFMLTENDENHLILNDFFNISNHVHLLPEFYTNFDSLEAFIKNQYSKSTNALIKMYRGIENIIYQYMVTDITAFYRGYVKGTTIVIEKSSPPSSRRYYINKFIIDSKKEGIEGAYD